VPQASASANTMPKGSPHWIARGAQRPDRADRFFAVVHLSNPLDAVMPDVGGRSGPARIRELRATIRMIARQDESAAAGLGDGQVARSRAFDGFEPG